MATTSNQCSGAMDKKHLSLLARFDNQPQDTAEGAARALVAIARKSVVRGGNVQ